MKQLQKVLISKIKSNMVCFAHNYIAPTKVVHGPQAEENTPPPPRSWPACRLAFTMTGQTRLVPRLLGSHPDYRPYSHKLLTINNYVICPSSFAFARLMYLFNLPFLKNLIQIRSTYVYSHAHLQETITGEYEGIICWRAVNHCQSNHMFIWYHHHHQYFYVDSVCPIGR